MILSRVRCFEQPDDDGPAARRLRAKPMGGTGSTLASARAVRSYAPPMHPSIHARNNPDKPAYIMAGSGETVTYRQLDEQSNRIAQLFRSLGLKAGDHIALFLENNARFFEICWGAQRSGLIYTAISSRLTAAEVDYIVSDCGAKAVRHLEVPRRPGGRAGAAADGRREALHDRRHDRGLRVVGSRRSRAFRRRRSPTRPRATTCSIRRAPPGGPRACCRWSSRSRSTSTIRCSAITRKLYGMDANTVYLSPAPLYHAAPLRFNMTRHAARRHVGDHGAFRRRGVPAAGRQVQGHAHPARADHVRALPEAARRGAAEIRRVVAAMRHPRRRPLPHPGQGEDDRLVGPDRLGVLRRHRRQRPHHLQRGGMAGAQGHGRPRRRRHAQDLRRGRQRAAGRRAGHGLFRRRPAVRVSQRSEEDRRIAPSPRVGRRWATWATSMPTASCT